MYPTHLMGTAQSGKREVKVRMKRAMSLVTKWSEETQKQSGKKKDVWLSMMVTEPNYTLKLSGTDARCNEIITHSNSSLLWIQTL